MHGAYLDTPNKFKTRVRQDGSIEFTGFISRTLRDEVLIWCGDYLEPNDWYHSVTYSDINHVRLHLTTKTGDAAFAFKMRWL